MRNDLIIGLDIGSSSVRAVAGRQLENGQLEIVATGSASTSGYILHGEIVNVNKTSSAIADAINQIAQSIPGKSKEYYFSSNLSGSHIKVLPYTNSKTRKNAAEPVSRKDILEITEEAKKIVAEKNPCVLHTLPIGFKVGNLPETLEPIGQIGATIQGNFMVITAQFDKFDLFSRTLKSAESEHIKGGNLYFSPLASSSSVLNSDEKQQGVVLVDIGSGTTEISIYQNKRLKHATVLNWGGDRITEDIRVGLDVTTEHAEALKTRFGTAMHRLIEMNEVVLIPGIAGRKPSPISIKNVAIIIEERMKELAAIVMAEIQKVTQPQLLRGGIVICGGGAQLPDLDELFHKTTGIETRIGVPDAIASMGLHTNLKDPAYATSIGLVQVYFDQVNAATEDNEQEPPTLPSSVGKPQTDKTKNPPPSIRDIFGRLVDSLVGTDGNDGGTYGENN
jgi:cell division protein FtsA